MNKYTEIIDKYLSGEMTAEEKRDFEKNLNNDPHLKTEFEAQQKILRGIERAGIKTEIKKGFNKGSFKLKTTKFLTTILITTLAVSLVWVAKNKFFSNNKENVRYELNEENKKVWSDADKQISPELFTINGKSDTIIETKGGIIITIPANAFLNATGNIELEVKEALNPLDIMKAGLSTTSDGKLLETGGMFYINARQDGKNLSIDNSKGLYISVPDNNPGKKMMLFEGKRIENGQLNWVDPKPFENKLNPVDILSLNFYPPHFLDSLLAFGFDIKNKRLTDSIYYSFVCGETEWAMPVYPQQIPPTNALQKKAPNVIRINNSIATIINTDEANIVRADSSLRFENRGSSICEISPSRIHAIWDRKFNNTILATKEFEERLQAIFETCNHSVLDLYINNMDKKMYELDSIAMEMVRENHVVHKFEEFYKRRDGGVSINESQMKKLQKYMEEKRKIYQDAAMTTMRKLYEKEKIQDERAMDEMIKHNAKENERINSVFKEELEINMKEAYRQLGKEYKPTRPPAQNYLSITIVNSGWKNVDAYVLESTSNRTTLDYTDRETGNKAVIKYEPITINVSDYAQYDKVVAYLLPSQLNSFQRIPNTGNIFKENLNELFQYGALVFGFKGDEVFGQHIVNAKPGETSLSLTKMTNEDLKQYRYMNTGAKIDMVSELNYQIFEQKEIVRKKAIVKREEVRNKLWQVVFPCYVSMK